MADAGVNDVTPLVMHIFTSTYCCFLDVSFDVMTTVRWNLCVVLIFICFITKDAEIFSCILWPFVNTIFFVGVHVLSYYGKNGYHKKLDKSSIKRQISHDLIYIQDV